MRMMHNSNMEFSVSFRPSEEQKKLLMQPFLPTSPQTPSKVERLMTSEESKEREVESTAPTGPSMQKLKKKLFHNETVEGGRQGRKIKSFLYTILNPRSRQRPAVCFKLFIFLVIMLDFISFAISTEPSFRDQDQDFFRVAGAITSTFFLVEYIARLYTCLENKKYGKLGEFWGRILFVATFASFVDLAATLPFFIEQLSGWELPTLTYLRAFRLLRYSTDEDYQKKFTGEETDDEDNDGEIKQALKLFLRADIDGSGSISLREYIEMSQLNRHNPLGVSIRKGGLAARLGTLERKVDDIAEKVNRLCNELAPPKTISWAY